MGKRIIDISDIVVKLRAINTSSNIAPWWIFFWEPWGDKEDNYVIVRLVSDNWDDVRIARLEFKVVAGTQWWTPTELQTIIKSLSDEITWNTCNNIFDFDWFKVLYVDYDNSFWPQIDDRNRLYMRADFLFTYARN